MNFAKWKEGHILHEFIYKTFCNRQDYRDGTDQWLPEAGVWGWSWTQKAQRDLGVTGLFSFVIAVMMHDCMHLSKLKERLLYVNYTSVDLGQGVRRKLEPRVGPGSLDCEYSVLSTSSPKAKGEGDIAWSWVGATLCLNAPRIHSPSLWGDPVEPHWLEQLWVLVPAPSTDDPDNQITNHQVSTSQCGGPDLPFHSSPTAGKLTNFSEWAIKGD